MSEEERDYLVEAVQQIAEFGTRFMADYDFNVETGAWSQNSESKKSTQSSGTPDFAACLKAARRLAATRKAESVSIELPHLHAELTKFAGFEVQSV
jgi:hypothetical protein